MNEPKKKKTRPCVCVTVSAEPHKHCHGQGQTCSQQNEGQTNCVIRHAELMEPEISDSKAIAMRSCHFPFYRHDQSALHQRSDLRNLRASLLRNDGANSHHDITTRCVQRYSVCFSIYIYFCTGGLRLRRRLKGARGLPVTVTAFKWLCPRVLPEVSGQLVASCKTPLTALP